MVDVVCEIRRAGYTADGKAILDMRSSGTFDWNWFLSTPEHGREILAIGMTAIVANKMIECQIADPVGPYAQVNAAFLVK